MSLARVADSVTTGWTADVEFLQLSSPINGPVPNPCTVDIGGVAIFWTPEEEPEGEEGWMLLNVTIPGSGEDPDVTDQEYVGYWLTIEDPPEWFGPEDFTVSPSFSEGPMYPYKVRDDEPKPPAYSAPRHSIHLGMKHAWGSPDYDSTYATGLGSTTVTEDQELVAAWAAAGGGTTELPGGTLNITVGHDASGFNIGSVSGLIVHITNIKMAGIAVDMESVRVPASGSTNGMHAEFGGDEVKFFCDDSNAASLNVSSFSVIVHPPVICDYRLRLWDWQEALVGDFSIQDPDPDETGRIAVASVYEQRVVYGREVYYNDATPVEDHGRRIWDIDVQVDPAWAVAADEVVDPTDAQCVLEESDLGMDPDDTWSGFSAVRAQEMSLQLPADADGVMPSPWVASGVGISVNQSGKTTEVTIEPTASNGSIVRTLATDYVAYRTTDKAAFGVPGCYRISLHRPATAYEPGSDIWCLENYREIGIDYTSEQADTLLLTITRTDIDEHDTHTEPNREADYDYTPDPGQTVAHAFSSVPGSHRTYVDLARGEDPRQRYVDTYEISGFDGAAEDWQFDLVDLVLVKYDPTDNAEVGYGDAKITFPRPAISYTGLTQTGEGIRICRPADQINTAVGEEGLDFTEQVGGTAEDFMRHLANWYLELARQEGFFVSAVADPFDGDTSGYNCREGHATYDASFVDGDGNDMLDDKLYTGDCVEQIDVATLAPIPVRPRVGHIYPLSGYPIKVYVDKILHGSIHGMVKSAGIPQGPDLSVQLYEQGTGIVALGLTDHFSRLRFPGEAGVRENYLGGVGAGTEPSAWYSMRNELRAWVLLDKQLLWDPDTDADAEGVVWRVAENGGVVYAHYLEPNEGAGWVAVTAPFGSTDEHWVPSVACLDDGALLVCATYAGDMVFVRSRDRGTTWEEVSGGEYGMAGLGDGLEYGKMWARYGCIHVCGWDSDKIWYAASSRYVALSREALNRAGDLVLEVAAAVVGEGEETPRSCVLRQDDGSVVVCVSFVNGDMKTYRAVDPDIGFYPVT